MDALTETIRLKCSARDALRDYIGQRSFDYFFTATFKREQKHPFTAIRRTSVAVLANWPEMSKGRALIVAEPFKLSGWHCHGLVKYPETPAIHGAIAETYLKKLGWYTFSSISNMDAVSAYCAKYLTKDDERSEWMVYGHDW